MGWSRKLLRNHDSEAQRGSESVAGRSARQTGGMASKLSGLLNEHFSELPSLKLLYVGHMTGASVPKTFLKGLRVVFLRLKFIQKNFN